MTTPYLTKIYYIRYNIYHKTSVFSTLLLKQLIKKIDSKPLNNDFFAITSITLTFN